MFQSLSGFLMRCDQRYKNPTHPDRGFQSLSGFLMRCDQASLACYRDAHAAGFQSLSGFLMRCDTGTESAYTFGSGFNPYRVF